MPFKKGQSGNINGRPIGSLNKQTSELRKKMMLLISESWEQIQRDFQELEGKDRISMFIAMSKYLLPTLKSVELIQDKNEIVQLSPEEREKEIERLKKKLYDN
jgi:hypothetical protein